MRHEWQDANLPASGYAAEYSLHNIQVFFSEYTSARQVCKLRPLAFA
jgi:hypothetical protein